MKTPEPNPTEHKAINREILGAFLAKHPQRIESKFLKAALYEIIAEAAEKEYLHNCRN